MMDMLSPGVATALLVIVLLAAAAGFVVMRVLGARAVEGDHPGEKGYASRPRTTHTGRPPTDKEPS